MNKKILQQIGFMALGAMVTRGIAGVIPVTANQKLVHGGLAVASGFGAMKVENPDLQSALVGASVVKLLDFGKSMFETTTTAQTLVSKTDTASLFLKGATGLGCPSDYGLGYAQEEEYAYLNGTEEVYIDEEGNVIGLGYADEEEYDLLNGADEEEVAFLNGVSQEEMSVL